MEPSVIMPSPHPEWLGLKDSQCICSSGDCLQCRFSLIFHTVLGCLRELSIENEKECFLYGTFQAVLIEMDC